MEWRKFLAWLKKNIVAVVVLTIAANLPAFAEHQIEFGGDYDLVDLAPADNDQVSVTFNLRLQNYYCADSADAEAPLQENLLSVESVENSVRISGAEHRRILRLVELLFFPGLGR